MSVSEIVIFGASGHAKVVVDIIDSNPSLQLIGFIDKDAPKGTTILGYDVIGDEGALLTLMKTYNFSKGVVGIGDNTIRRKVVQNILNLAPEFEFVNCIHSSANISEHCQLGMGNVVMPGVTINAASVIADHCILNTHSSLDHDSTMHSFSSLSPHVAVGGNCRIGQSASIGIGASVFHGISIGDHCVIGGGSVVNTDTQANATYYGVPAKRISRSDIDKTE